MTKTAYKHNLCFRKKNNCMYFNYHAKLKRLINENHATKYEIFDNWNGIKPALVIFFDNHPPMPVRIHKWREYLPLLEEKQVLQDN